MSDSCQSLLAQLAGLDIGYHTLLGDRWVPTRSRGGVTDV